MNHRALQRVFFRMLMDETFRTRVLEADSGLELGLDERELHLLRSLSPEALGADRDDARRRQALGNLLGEFQLSAALAPKAWFKRGFPQAFLESENFHDAIELNERLPLAFADWFCEKFQDGDAALSEIQSLEAALVRCRRAEERIIKLDPQEVLLAADCQLHEAALGLAQFVAQQNSQAEPKKDRIVPHLNWQLREVLLLRRRRQDNSFALPEVDIEELNAAMAGLLRLAEEPLGPAARADYAQDLGVSSEELESFVDDLVADEVLIRGR